MNIFLTYFYRNTYIERLNRIIALSRSFSRHHLQTNKKNRIQNNLVFSICEQFLIPLRGAGMKLSISDLLEHWYGLVEYAKKILSLTRLSYLVNGVKSLRH